MIKVICTCSETAHFDYARVETTNFEWISAKVKFFQSLGLSAVITVSVDDVRTLAIYVLPTSIEFENFSDSYLDLNDEIAYHVLHEA